ncbi:hypothetical protein DPMN_069700 [Dreissena polymorpha]|uniref:Uncharacterized protein n=1 Tax=Dreissena polymorpha TaxID=45954 RepID=A0A9D3Z1Y9_DREPO|nr:hypothetical protein DPMN_069700 [Dreissena polymorpha]
MQAGLKPPCSPMRQCRLCMLVKSNLVNVKDSAGWYSAGWSETTLSTYETMQAGLKLPCPPMRQCRLCRLVLSYLVHSFDCAGWSKATLSAYETVNAWLQLPCPLMRQCRLVWSYLVHFLDQPALTHKWTSGQGRIRPSCTLQTSLHSDKWTSPALSHEWTRLTSGQCIDKWTSLIRGQVDKIASDQPALSLKWTRKLHTSINYQPALSLDKWTSGQYQPALSHMLTSLIIDKVAFEQISLSYQPASSHQREVPTDQPALSHKWKIPALSHEWKSLQGSFKHACTIILHFQPALFRHACTTSLNSLHQPELPHKWTRKLQTSLHCLISEQGSFKTACTASKVDKTSLHYQPALSHKWTIGQVDKVSLDQLALSHKWTR